MRQTIMVLDDEPDNVALMAMSLHRALPEADVATFTSPRMALAWCALNDPALCLIDHQMPEMTGLDFLARVRTERRLTGVPVLFLTATADPLLRQQAYAAGATDFVAKPVDVDNVIARCRSHLALRATLKGGGRPVSSFVFEQGLLLHRLARFSGFHDIESVHHMQRVGFMAAIIGEGLGLSSGECDRLAAAAPYHDIGMVGVPEAVLMKQGRYTDAERAAMQTHAEIGYALLKESPVSVLRLAGEIAYGHHERVDGSGYPLGLVGEAIPLAARIVAVADVFDALIHQRPHKQAWAPGDVFAHLRRARGTALDADCVDAFLAAIDPMMEIQMRMAEGAAVPGAPPVGAEIIPFPKAG